MRTISEVLLRTEHLDVRFPVKRESVFAKRRFLRAVSDVSIEIHKGETFGLVGESGCGKSTFANATLGFVEPYGGRIEFDGEPLDIHDKQTLRKQRSRMQKIFQAPGTSLNPRFTVEDAVAEPLRIRGGLTREEEHLAALEILERVGLSANDLSRFTSEFSGGQQQRIAIARALILRPEYLVCDEPVSSLDVSVHAQILNLLKEMQRQLGTTYLFISHNLAVVRKLCERIAIMYMGRVVEYGRAEAVFSDPRHPYTRALLSAVLDIDPDNDEVRHVLDGDVASPIDPPGGCLFAPRCPEARALCPETPCKLVQCGPEHFAACPFAL